MGKRKKEEKERVGATHNGGRREKGEGYPGSKMAETTTTTTVGGWSKRGKNESALYAHNMWYI